MKIGIDTVAQFSRPHAYQLDSLVKNIRKRLAPLCPSEALFHIPPPTVFSEQNSRTLARASHTLDERCPETPTEKRISKGCEFTLHSLTFSLKAQNL